MALAVWLAAGCSLISRRYAGPAPDGSTMPMPNPMVVPAADPVFTWNQIVDMTDDYFDIAQEQPVREIGGVLMEGRVLSQPKSGATILEPMRKDSTPGYERWHSTLQSTRRTAQLRVIPVSGGFQVHVEVRKELEDVAQAEYSTVTSSVRRHDGSLVAFDRRDPRRGPATLGWIPLGRDSSLEQEMLRNLHARLFQATLAARQRHQP